MSAVFHLFAIFVKVVEPDDMSTCLTLFSKVRNDCSSTCDSARIRTGDHPRARLTDASRMDAESHPQKRLRRHLLGRLVLEVPDAVAVRERLEVHAALGLDADLEPALCTREARRRSDDRDDAIDANFNFGKREKRR